MRKQTHKHPLQKPGLRSRAAISCLLILSLSGCSYEAMYKSIQQDNLRACEEIPIAQQAGCKARYQTDYDTYRRQRAEILEN